ncbi:putative glycoside hydrolase [uncultured Acetobacteroides sp.]|uniref:putative glycoside hydrolase n=1 Tax=uncultured Acetobacteroides sp. TaxID=1760811 RepID=UPI0029F5CA2D|nr:putative glycoside hydrolase [uncultured Acetobacteroides sp.]
MRKQSKGATCLGAVALLLGVLAAGSSHASRHALAGQSATEPVKGLYLSGWSAGNPSVLRHFVELANRTEINAYVIDVKEDDGRLSYPSQVKEVNKIGSWVKKYDPATIIAELHRNHIRAIGRIVCFKDPILPVKRPDLALKDRSGKVWKDNDGMPWLNPYNKGCWRYLVSIAKEAVALGFDEIQFDYVRFTQNGDLSTVDFGRSKQPRYAAINGFLAYARQQLPHVVLSADVFGIICESAGDTEGIGQYLELVGKDMDFLSPMIYPSHYACGQEVNEVAFPIPDLDPYGVVYNALCKTRSRVAPVKGYRATIRPYLQDFTASYLKPGTFQTYGAEQVRQQIKAVYDAGYQSWLFWNINGEYSEAAFLPKAAATLK